jgi:glycosyltransferase involved in cell wall biosynthesis
MNPLKISIVIPAYNEEEYIASAIECFLKMTYYPLEIIVVDDGSIDRTAEIASNFPIKLIQIKHSGPAKAKNIGIKEADGELIVIHDANDIILDDNFLTKISETYISSGKRADEILMSRKILPRKHGLINKAMFIRDYLAHKPKMENRVPVVKLLSIVAFKSEFLKYYAKYKEDLGTMEDTFFSVKKEPQKFVSKYVSAYAIGGAMDSLKQMMSRWIWGGKGLIPIWKYSKRIFLLKAGYGVYSMSFIVTLPLLFLTVNPLLLLYIPLLTRIFYRAGKAYFYTRHMILSLLLPFLDLLQGLCYFIGLLKAIILVVLKRYTPAK